MPRPHRLARLNLALICRMFVCRLLACLLLCISVNPPLQALEIMTDARGQRYVTGGIGSEEVEALQAYKKQFNLYFVFTEGKIGRVIDDVNLSILDGQNQLVFAIKHANPRLLLQLPAGRYQAVANYQGQKLRQWITAEDKRHQRIILNWPAQVEEESKLSQSPAEDTE